MSHWEAMAHENVVDALLRASLRCDVRSLPGKIAGERLLALANAEDLEMVQKLLAERDNCQIGMATALRSMLP